MDEEGKRIETENEGMEMGGQIVGEWIWKGLRMGYCVDGVAPCEEGDERLGLE